MGNQIINGSAPVGKRSFIFHFNPIPQRFKDVGINAILVNVNPLFLIESGISVLYLFCKLSKLSEP